MADAAVADTEPAAVPGTVARVRAAFDAGVTRPLAWRRAQVRLLPASARAKANSRAMKKKEIKKEKKKRARLMVPRGK
mgnify:CR=1 FL=1